MSHFFITLFISGLRLSVEEILSFCFEGRVKAIVTIFVLGKIAAVSF